MNFSFLEIKSFLNKYDIDLMSDIPDNSIFSNISSLSNSKPNFITFFNDDKLFDSLQATKSKACLISEKNKHKLPLNCLPILVKDPYLSFAYLSKFFNPKIISSGRINKEITISDDIILGKNIQINSNVSFVGKVKISDNVIIFDNCVIGPNVSIKENSVIYPNCTISNTLIGSNCLVQSGTVIGDRGFGFTPKDKIELVHIGNVVISDNVQIGSNTTIDRALLDSTIIGSYVRIDNLVHIAHGVSIGDNTIIAGQVGIAGSASIGKNCLVGGQAGIAGHISIGDNVKIAAKSGVTKNIKDNAVVAGFPALDIITWKKINIKQQNSIK